MYPRFIAERLTAALADTPVVMLIGPRQAGKTTLARHVAAADRRYITLDEAPVREAALHDPVGFVRRLDKAIIDEIQRAPELLLAIKQSVDGDRRPGRFLLTGSAHVMTLPRVADSLAGRMETITLYPLSRSEILGKKPSFLANAFASKIPHPIESVIGDALIEIALIGGYPDAHARAGRSRHQHWLRGYVNALLQRDIKEIAAIERLGDIPKLLRILAEHSGQLTNLSQIGGQVGLDDKTTRRYLAILEQLFLLILVEPWFTNRLKRLIKSPKLHFLDSGVLAAVQGLTQARLAARPMLLGALLESFVVSEILKQATWADSHIRIHHFRDREQHEVDILIEDDREGIVGVETKASATVGASDFKALRQLQAANGRQFRLGIVLYDGAQVLPFGDRMVAAPFPCLWS